MLREIFGAVVVFESFLLPKVIPRNSLSHQLDEDGIHTLFCSKFPIWSEKMFIYVSPEIVSYNAQAGLELVLILPQSPE